MKASPERARLTIRKPTTLPFQEVRLFTDAMDLIRRETLTESKPGFTETVDPGRYIATGMTPTGATLHETIDIGAGEAMERSLHGQAEPSPHEWLADLSQRRLLPESELAMPAELQQSLPTLDVESLRGASPRSAFSMPVLQSLESEEQVSGDIDRLLARRSRPGRDTLRETDVSLRTYAWSSEQNRWLRSDLIELADGLFSPDFTHLTFPPRTTLNSELRRSIHLVGAFQPGKATRYIALPLFSDGAELVISQKTVERQADDEERQAGDEGRQVDEERSSPAESDPKRRISWRLAAQNADLDALLQSLNGRAFRDQEALAEGALSMADTVLFNKIRDPEAAIVSAYFLLQYRELDRRADWIDNLSEWFPWSPDALVLGAWGSLLFGDADEAQAQRRLAEVYKAGPPQFQPGRRILRDLLSLFMEEESANPSRPELEKLWKRLGREFRREVQGGPFYSFARSPD